MILDIMATDSPGLVVVGKIRQRWPHPRVVVLTSRQHHRDGPTDREREVMRRIALGHRTREIAVTLSLSIKTIEKYRSSIMRKLGLKTATAVAAYATANGYLDN